MSNADSGSTRNDGRVNAALAFAQSFQNWYDQNTQELSRTTRGVPLGHNPIGHWIFCIVGLSLPIFVCGMVFVLGRIGLSPTLETFEKVGYFFGLGLPLFIVAAFAFAMSFFRAKLHTYEYSLWRGARFGFWVCMLIVNTMLLTTLLGFVA